jgi:hypothetical protein
MLIERRERRCSDPLTALSFFLEAERERRGARALVLGTLDGRALAGAGDADPWDVASSAALRIAGLGTSAPSDDAFVMTVVGGAADPLVLTAVGGVDTPGSVEHDIHRILGERLRS